MAETEYRVCAGLLNIGSTGELVYYVCAGIPNAWVAEEEGLNIPIVDVLFSQIRNS